MATIEEYRQKEQQFIATEALCDDVPPALCDCSKCPARGLCQWLTDNDPFRGGEQA